MAAISAVFTIDYVANLLGENEGWLHDLSIDMFSEDGCLRVDGIAEDGVTAFTEYGIGVDPIKPDTQRVGKGCTPEVSDSPAGNGDARCCSPPSSYR